MTDQLTPDKPDARQTHAERAAAKAYRRALRPWYKRTSTIIAAAVVGLLLLAMWGSVLDTATEEPSTVKPKPEPEAVNAEPVPDPEPIGEESVAAGDSCNPHTGEAGPGTGLFEEDIDGGLSCVGQAGEADPAPAPNPAIIEEPEPDPAMQIGDGAEFTTDGALTETITIESLEYSTSPYDEYGSTPKEQVFLIFGIRVDAVASTAVYEDDFYVVTRDGERIDLGSGNAWDAIDYDDMFGYAELNSGQHKSGYLVFDSPVRHGTLEYDPNYGGEPIAVWEF